MELQNSLGWERPKRSLSSTPCCGQGHLLLNQVAPWPIQPGLGHFHVWGIHSLPEQPVQTSYHYHSKEFRPNILYKAILFQLSVFNWCVWFLVGLSSGHAFIQDIHSLRAKKFIPSVQIHSSASATDMGTMHLLKTFPAGEAKSEYL